MPLVSPSGGGFTGITVEIQGKIDDITNKLTSLDKSFDQFSASAKAASAASETSAKKATLSWTDFRSMYSTVLDAVRVGEQVWAATGQKYVDYAEQVRTVSRSIGSTTEEASRLIKVADDVGLSYTTMSTAMKLAQKQGIDTSIAGLSKLAGEYTKLKPGMERTQFLLATFGRSGAEMGRLMELGADGVTKATAAVEKNLILTQKAVDSAHAYTIATDQLKDAWDGLTYQAGPPLVAMATTLVNKYRDITTSLQENGYWYTLLHQGDLSTIAAQREKSDALLQVQKNTTDATAATEDFTKATKAENPAVVATTKALDDYKKQLDSVSKANQDAESFMQSYADSQKTYVKNHADAVANLTKAQAGGDKGGIADAQKAIQDLEATWHESTNKMIYDMVLAKVSVDGLTDAEFKATNALAVSMGIRTQADADQANAAMDKANAIVDGISKQEDVMREKEATDAKQLQLENDKKAAADGTTAAIVNGSNMSVDALNNVVGTVDSATRSLIAMGNAASRTAGATSSIHVGGAPATYSTPRVAASNVMHARDSGGPGVAGTPYMIGTGAQPEVFVPSTGGNFIPNADKKGIGATYNVVINNPKTEKSEESIRKALKNLSYMGVSA